jgi:hypothetical protein
VRVVKAVGRLARGVFTFFSSAAIRIVRSFVSACAPPSPTPQCVKPKKVVLARVKRWRGHRLSTLHFANHACFAVQILPRRLLEENMAESCAQTLYVSYCKRP